MTKKYVYAHCPYCEHVEKTEIDERGKTSAEFSVSSKMSLHKAHCPKRPRKDESQEH